MDGSSSQDRISSRLCDNQSVNLSPVVRFFAVAKNPPTFAGYLPDLPRSESDGQLEVELSSRDATMDGIPFKGLSPRSMDYHHSRIQHQSAPKDKIKVPGKRPRSKDYRQPKVFNTGHVTGWADIQWISSAFNGPVRLKFFGLEAVA